MSNPTKILNFGPSALNSADSFRYAASLIKGLQGERVLIFTAAIDGVVSSLEEIVKAHQVGELGKAMDLLNALRKTHTDISTKLLGESHSIHDDLNDHFVTIEWDLEDPAHEDYDFAYDQIVAVGSLLSSQLLAAWLRESQTVEWVDVRDMILVDDDFRKGKINVEETKTRAQRTLRPLFDTTEIVVTQSGLGTTTENYSITLNPEEGSAYSAVVLGDALESPELYIWAKPLTANANLSDNVIKLDRSVG